jgi:hypothetical protein
VTGAPPPQRTVHNADAFAWMAAHPAESIQPSPLAVITSLPDVSELPLPFPAWRLWFMEGVRNVIAWTPLESIAIFFQSDIKRDGIWVDKGYLVQRAAEDAGASILFHKIVCRKPPGTIALGRPSFSHMIGVTRGAPKHADSPGPDVLPDAGHMPWSRAMGETACKVAIHYAVRATNAKAIVDPFCGQGTVLSIANEMGLDAVGVDLSAKRCKQARAAR